MAIITMQVKGNTEKETIEFLQNGQTNDGGETIKNINFKMNTLNDETLNRASAVRYELQIEGQITKENREETRKLAKWSMDNDNKTLYRNVEIVVYNGDSADPEVLRRYFAENMFVIDYEEKFYSNNENTEIGEFMLFIAQKEGKNSKDIYAE